MLLYFDIALILVLLCVGFYNKKWMWLWCIPTIFFAVGLLIGVVYLAGNRFSLSGFFDSALWSSVNGFYPVFFGISFLSCAVTECIRQIKKKKSAPNQTQGGA